MRILQLHVNWIEWTPVKKEIEVAEDVEKKKYRVEDALVILTAVEKGDNKETGEKAIEEVDNVMKQLGVKKIVIYPYAHLSSDLAKPQDAIKTIKSMVEYAEKLGLEVYHAPFGWNKELALSIKGHPLAEAGKSVSVEGGKKFKTREVSRISFEPLSGKNELAAHIVAKALKKVFQEAKLGDFGEFEEKVYYEFKIKPLKQEEVDKIQKEIDKISKNIEYEVKEYNSKDAVNLFKEEKLKKIVLDKVDKVRVIKIGNFYDICKGEPKGKKLFIKILGTSSSYWKPAKESMQRVWFVAFENKKELGNYLKKLEEIKKRDHRYIGEKMDIFHVEENIIGSGLPLIHPKGMVIRNELIKLIREVNDSLGFKEIWTPHLSKTILWKISGHYDKYKDKMFLWEMEGEEWGLKPMNCPLHLQIYKFRPRSYRELPIRYSEFATVYRKEQSGELHGLARVWSLTQDDHHILLMPNQIKEEIKRIVNAIIKVYNIFNLEYRMNLSTKPEKYIGDDELWEIAEKSLKEVLEEIKKEKGVSFEVKEGEGAFYGPKIDFDVKDAMGRWWQLGTIQLDFFMPKRFEIKYVDKDSKEKTPVMIHLAILGSLERFMAMIIEHFKGRFPVWLAPIQVRILPLSEKYVDEAEKLKKEIKEIGGRVEVAPEGTLSYRIRSAEIDKIPIIVVIGEKEIESGTLSIRKNGKNTKMERTEFLNLIKEIIKNRKE